MPSPRRDHDPRFRWRPSHAWWRHSPGFRHEACAGVNRGRHPSGARRRSRWSGRRGDSARPQECDPSPSACEAPGGTAAVRGRRASPPGSPGRPPPAARRERSGRSGWGPSPAGWTRTPAARGAGARGGSAAAPAPGGGGLATSAHDPDATPRRAHRSTQAWHPRSVSARSWDRESRRAVRPDRVRCGRGATAWRRRRIVARLRRDEAVGDRVTGQVVSGPVGEVRPLGHRLQAGQGDDLVVLAGGQRGGPTRPPMPPVVAPPGPAVVSGARRVPPDRGLIAVHRGGDGSGPRGPPRGPGRSAIAGPETRATSGRERSSGGAVDHRAGG